MWEFPFISRRSHLEVLAAKDETIALFRADNENLTASLKAFDSLLESLKPKPRVVGASAERKPAAPAINYARLDPKDNEALVRAALAEMGGGKHNIGRVQQRVEHIRRQILAAQRQSEDNPVAAAPPPPDSINALINEAIAEGEAAGGASVRVH